MTAATLAACSSDTSQDTQPKLISAFSGEGQSATVGTAVGTAFTVRVIDGSGRAVAGAQVNFVATGGTVLSAASATTDANGLASTTATLGTRSGVDSITASVAGASIDPTIFLVSANPGAPSAIVALNGTGQSATRGSSVTLDAVVTDQFGNAVPNTLVDWTTTAGTLLPVAVTDATGTAADVIQLPGTAMTVTVTATIDGTPKSAQFTYTVQ